MGDKIKEIVSVDISYLVSNHSADPISCVIFVSRPDSFVGHGRCSVCRLVYVNNDFFVLTLFPVFAGGCSNRVKRSSSNTARSHEKTNWICQAQAQNDQVTRVRQGTQPRSDLVRANFDVTKEDCCIGEREKRKLGFMNQVGKGLITSQLQK